MLVGYDIRGKFGEDITPQLLFEFGYSLKGKRFVVGGDPRRNTYPLIFSLISGMLSSGKEVYFAGIHNIGYVVFSGVKKKAKTAYITASHLPKEYNGLKLYDEKGIGYIDENLFKGSQVRKISPGIFERIDFEEDYINLVEGMEIEKRIAVDFGCGATSILGRKIWEKVTKGEYVPVNQKVDDDIRCRNPEPKVENLKELKRFLKEVDLGVAYDYDGDRVIFLERSGRQVYPEEIALMYLLENNGKKIVMNVACIDIFSEYGIKVKYIPVGHDALVRESYKEKPDIGIEASGHTVIPRYTNWDDALISSIVLSSFFDEKYLKEIPRIGKREIKIRISKKTSAKEIFEGIRKRYETVEIDGVRINFGDWFFLIRESKTEKNTIKITIGWLEKEGIEEIIKREIKVISKIIEKKIKIF